MLLVDRAYPDVSVALVNDLTHGRNQDRELAHYVAACMLLEQ